MTDEDEADCLDLIVGMEIERPLDVEKVRIREADGTKNGRQDDITGKEGIFIAR